MHRVAIVTGLLLSSAVAYADSAAPVGYWPHQFSGRDAGGNPIFLRGDETGPTKTFVTVYVNTYGTQRNCPDAEGLLRQDEMGNVIKITACDPLRTKEFIDECVAPGTYFYGSSPFRVRDRVGS